jgi:hypothetical protein
MGSAKERDVVSPVATSQVQSHETFVASFEKLGQSSLSSRHSLSACGWGRQAAANTRLAARIVRTIDP